jgi:RHS repeat-associated protein
VNKAAVPGASLMGGSSEFTYNYDDLYRLMTAQGHYKGANEEHSYTLAMAYNSVGGITQKTQHHLKKGNEQKKTSYNMAYTYGEEQPHAPTHIGDQTYTYDANGNQSGWTSDKSGQRRNMMWDEENRLRSVQDNGAVYQYIYDASGERVIKGKNIGQRVFVNGEIKASSGGMGNYQIYVNPYIVLRSGGYTKHYYIEGQRIASKLGGGWDNNGKGPLKAGDGKVNYPKKTQDLVDAIVKNLKFLGADGQILTAGNSGKTPPGQLKGGTSTAESFRYFYHPDHLGSTSYVTDAAGEVYQHLEYFAFGETFVEEHSNTDRTPYLFNGKELDEETGLYYYGARYYDPRTSVWLAVDKLSDDAPSWTPYRYGFNNPIRYSDPGGKFEIDEATKKAYPKLDAYLKTIASEFKGKPENFRKAFKQWSGLSDKEISNMLEYGKGPKLSVRNLDEGDKKTNGSTYRTAEKAGTDINKVDKDCNCNIAIDDDVVNFLEKATTKDEVGAAKLFVESTILHEGTHYGDNKDGKKTRDKEGNIVEVGKEFEKQAYGEDVGRKNHKEIYKKVEKTNEKKSE